MTNILNRRNVLRLAAIAPAVGLYATQAQAKIPQTAVGYQMTPHNESKCSNCNLFVAPNACKTVDGEINPEGWCKIWAKKPAG